VTLGLEGPRSGASAALHRVGASAILTLVGGEGAENWTELLISLETLLVVGCEPVEDYDDNYLRKYAGAVRIQGEDGERPNQAGEIEVWYIDGSHAADNEFDIVDVCDSMTQAEYEARIIRKIAGTLGYHCAAIVFDPDRVGIADEDDELELKPTKAPSVFALTDI
jgi:hypothetical protein